MKVKNDIIVMKFGGTSVGNIDKIKKVADRVIKSKNEDLKVVVVVSAMGDTTDNLIDLAGNISKEPGRREMDMLLSTGEQVSIALLAIAIQSKGYDCVSLTGNQAGIYTDDAYSNAKILHISNARIIKELKSGKIVIVAGFQGITSNGDISTLGRGGSDTTALALAASLGADYCEIYTDVDGVYTTDPNIVPEAKKIEVLSYDEMLELASSGAKVLHLRAVEFAKRHDVILHVRSSFNDNEGTWVMDKNIKSEKMERPVVTGVANDTNQVKISIFGLPDIPGVAAKLFSEFANANISIDLIVQNVSEKSIATISFTIKNEDINEAKRVLGYLKKSIEFKDVNIDPDVAKVSIVGAGMQTHPGVAAKMFNLLGNENINIEMISTSPIRISCVIRKDKIKNAVKVLHSGFELDKEKGL
jgi:aspartate kinase